MTPTEKDAVSRWQFSVIEKVIGGTVMALLGWMALTTQATATKVAVIEARISMMALNPYNATDAAKDRASLEERISANTNRIAALERGRAPQIAQIPE